MSAPVARHPTATAARTVAGRRSVTAGALARLASIAAVATISWPDGLGAVGIQTLNLPILAASGLLLCTVAPAAHHRRHDRPGLRLVLLVVSALSVWAVPSVLAINLGLVHFALTEPGELCHDVPCREAWH